MVKPQATGSDNSRLRARVGRFGAALGLLLATMAGMPAANAQNNYPDRPVRTLVGIPAGGLADVIARSWGQKMSEALGQPFVIDNKPGASGVLAVGMLAKSPPDGHTLFVTPDSMIVFNQFVYPKLPYDPNKDIQSVALLGKASLVLVANPSLGVKTAADLFKLAKEKPGTIAFSSGGPGHALHIAYELVQSRMGFSMMHVPYKGAAPATQAVLAGEVQTMIIGIPESMPHIKAGKLIPLAATGPGAQQMFPNLPLLKSFHPDLDLSVWLGVFGPAGMKPEVVGKLNAATNNYLNAPEVRAKFAEFGITPMPGPVSDLDAIIRADRAKFGPLIKSLGITVD